VEFCVVFYDIVMQYDGEMTSHYPPIDGIASSVYDPAATGHHGRVTGSLPLQPSAALPRSPTYSPHPSATAAVSSLASPYPAGGGGSTAGYPSAASAAAAAAAAAMNTSSAAAVAAVDSLLKRDKDAIYRQAYTTQHQHQNNAVLYLLYSLC